MSLPLAPFSSFVFVSSSFVYLKSLHPHCTPPSKNTIQICSDQREGWLLFALSSVVQAWQTGAALRPGAAARPGLPLSPRSCSRTNPPAHLPQPLLLCSSAPLLSARKTQHCSLLSAVCLLTFCEMSLCQTESNRLYTAAVMATPDAFSLKSA